MAKKVKARIILNNQKSRLIADLKTKMQVRKVFAIKSKNAFWSPAFQKGDWDGWVRYIGEESGLFATGLIHQLCKHLDDLNVKYTIEDNRELFKDLHTPKELGGLKLFKHQEDSRASLVNNTFKGIRFQRGILNDATNAGKSLIAGSIIASFSRKRYALFLVNNKDIFDQALPDLQTMLGKEEVGWIKSASENPKRINVCMVQTLGARIKKDPKYRNLIAKSDIVIMDEADEVIGRKDAKQILTLAHNATIRIALTGTALKSKDPLKNQEQIAYFGPVLHVTTNKELVDKGISTPPIIKFTKGNDEIRNDSSWDEEYKWGILRNKIRHRRIWARVYKHASKDRLPILILFRHHAHAKRLMDMIPIEISKDFTVEVVHGKTPNRLEIFNRFNEGKIDILLASMIIKRGKNLPLIKVLVNAAGGDSEQVILQIFGRALRKHASKKRVIIEEFWDIGKYLRRHSNHRKLYYKAQGFPVKELLNKKTINNYAKERKKKKGKKGIS
jgi:superfamily II DNA or RNA helicase